ncbi:hypothetical protein H1164_15365 [Thermoactinomyces daqus]|uniref:Hsp20/alpha crystallin family protein n=1 Tax=Thermoactinomyces daqus TaxID=1329516 RepID=A0A7W1XCP1_9BACL|nr:Hsp20/alpha crystallin family protein [Thermoactinomyces daqus]MBA4544234.1 hypothetical protein [Thermoactinomyces daqus]
MREDKNIWGFHWEEMNRMFQEASGGTGRSLFSVDFNWMEEIIKTSLDKAFSENHDLQKSYSIPKQYHISEQNDKMVVQVPTPENTDVKDIRLFLDVNRLMITGINEDKELITLPVRGDCEGSEAHYKNGMLEIYIPKDKRNNFTEIMIQHA